MKKPSYPISLNLTGRRVLVAGAGRVATRKIERLVEAGATLHVVAIEASPVVQQLAEAGHLALTLRSVVQEDARGAMLVLCATNDADANKHLAAAGREQGALVSRVDAPQDSDFTVPAVARGESVDATVSTRGTAPSGSRRLAKELRSWVRNGPDRFAREMAHARAALRSHPDAAARLSALANGALFEACATADEGRIATLIAEALGTSAAREAPP